MKITPSLPIFHFHWRFIDMNKKIIKICLVLMISISVGLLPYAWADITNPAVDIAATDSNIVPDHDSGNITPSKNNKKCPQSCSFPGPEPLSPQKYPISASVIEKFQSAAIQAKIWEEQHAYWITAKAVYDECRALREKCFGK